MRTLLYSIFSVTLLAGVSGCSSLEKMPSPFSGAKQEARRSVAVWSPAARVVGGVPERGFAGRVTFFGNDPKKGVKVDGDIVVYAFDEYPNRSASDTKPDKTYPFLAEDMKHLQSHSKKLGYSYSLWVPWDNDGPDGERKTVSLIVKLVPKNGGAFNSGQAKCVLPGKEPLFVANTARQTGPISQVNYQFGRNDRFEEELPPGFRDWTKQDFSVITPEERQIRTTNRPMQMVKTSISVPGNMSSAILQNNPAVNPLELIAAQSTGSAGTWSTGTWSASSGNTNRNGWNPSQVPPGMLQHVPEANPVAAAAYHPHAQPHNGQTPGVQAPMPPQNFQNLPPYLSGPAPTDVTTYNQLPPSAQSVQPPARVEQQGNTTVMYSSPIGYGPGGYGAGTNPLSRVRM